MVKEKAFEGIGAPLDCSKCEDLVQSRSRVVNGVGNGSSGLMLVGEAPGRKEDMEGEPFVGRSGEILDGVLEDLGCERKNVRVTNIVRCRPPGNRDPLTGEIDNCRSFLLEEIEFFKPEVLMALGRKAAHSLTEENFSLKKNLGRKGGFKKVNFSVDVFVNYHPAATLYDIKKLPFFKKVFEEALKFLKECS